MATEKGARLDRFLLAAPRRTAAEQPARPAVALVFKAVGGAPTKLHQTRATIDAHDRLEVVAAYAASAFGEARVLLYLHDAFAPPLEERVGALAAEFGRPPREAGGRRELVVSYSLTPAWG